MPIVSTLPLFQIKENQSYAGVEGFLNVYWYIQLTGVTALALDVANAFNAKFSVPRRATANTGWQSVLTEADQVNSLSNFAAIAGYGAGTLSDGSQLAPQFVASSIRLLRTTKETRSGWKRYMGLTELAIQGATLAPAYLALMQTLAINVGGTLTVGLNTLFPVIVAKTYSPGPPRELNPPELWLYNLVSAAQAVDRTTTQNTRKNFS